MNTSLAILPFAVFAASGMAHAAAEAPVPVTEVRVPAVKTETPAPVKVAAATAHEAKPAEARPAQPVAVKPAEDKPAAKPAEPPKPEAKKTSLMDVAAGPAAATAKHGHAAKPAAVRRSAPRATSEQIVARRGDTLDRLVATRFNHLPFRPDVLREALARVNAGALQPGSRTRLVAGAKVTLPADAEVQRLVLGGDHDDGQAHEPTNPVLTSQGWICFP